MGSEAQYCVVVTSVGRARPSAAVAVANGLGVPVDRTLHAIYRAPSLLVANVEREVAEKLCTLLAEVGLDTMLTDSPPADAERELVDVALHIRDPARAYEIAEAVAGFCACDGARALSLITTPPGIVLGGVTRPTVAALERHLPDGAAELVASDPRAARYMLVYVGDSRTVRAQVEAALAGRDLDVDGAGDVLSSDLGFDDAQALWATFGRSGAVRLVNRDFLRFEIWLDGALDGVGDEASRSGALAAHAGIPADRVASLLGRLPFVVEDGVAHGALEARMRLYAEAGLKVRAELTTFQKVALELVAANDPHRVAGAAARLGFPERLVPPCITAAMPEAHARIARAVLEAAGGEVYFAVPAHG